MRSATSSMLTPIPVTTVIREVRTFGLTVSAGFPSPTGDDLEDTVDIVAWIVRHEHSTFWWKVAGNSLCLEGIMDGDWVAIDKAGKVAPGRIVLAVYDNDMLLKLLVRREGRLWLEARSTEKYPALPVTETTEFWGVVAGIARRYPVE